MVEQDWDRFNHWHTLLDALCDRHGHVDNAKLASQLCRRSGKNGQEDFNAAEKNLRNWRLGRHAPLRRNFMILSELLDVGTQPELKRRWEQLYAAARGREANAHDDLEPAGENATPAPARLRHGSLWLAGSAAALMLVAGGVNWLMADPHADLPMIGYEAQVRMVVGESRLVHGDRGDCGGTPPDWYYTLPRVPASTLGTFSDGGIARRASSFCKAVTPVRAVRFTAVKAGVEEVKLLDDFMKIVVTDQGLPRAE